MTTPTTFADHRAFEKAANHQIALNLGRKPDSTSWHGSATSMAWRNAEGAHAVLRIAGDADGAFRFDVDVTDAARANTFVSGDSSDETAIASFMAALTTLAACFPAPLGRILVNAETDRFDNKVSIALLPGGERVRIVHHPRKAAHHRRWRSTAYRSRGVFLRIEEDLPSNDCVPSTLRVGSYTMSWGDGELLGFDNAPGGPVLHADQGGPVQHQDMEKGILLVLGGLHSLPELWETKDVAPRLAA